MNAGWRIWIVILVTLAPVGGCADYSGNGDEPECYTVADCNPGKECGEDMIKCIDGKCDPEQTEDLSCLPCTSDQDCQAGMHCRVDVCVADGYCADVSECLELPHYECLGSFTCSNGLCKYECADLTSCSQDADCVLADKDCCCGFDAEDYLSIRGDKLSVWYGREECQLVDCPAVVCNVPASIEAVCEQGECTVGMKNDDWFACDADSDCVKVAADCCGCQNGGGEKVVNKDFEETYLKELNDFCAVVDVKCESYDTCTTFNAVCHQGLCTTLREKCGCGDVWDPVCGGTGGLMYTFGSECEADCVEMPWDYHGNCDCTADCDGGLGMQVCANNGQSYWCGEWEAGCNGQTVHYPGDCREECDICDMLGRPSIPVCGEDFRYYPDMCYAECHELQWWHQGECLPGEGGWCGGIMGQACESSELFCLIPQGCMDCTGACIAVGSCMQAEDCIGQPLVGDDCEGQWICPNHICTWQCD